MIKYYFVVQVSLLDKLKSNNNVRIHFLKSKLANQQRITYTAELLSPLSYGEVNENTRPIVQIMEI